MARELRLNVTSDFDDKGIRKAEQSLSRSEKVTERTKGAFGKLSDELKTRLGPAGTLVGGVMDKAANAIGSVPTPIAAVAGAAALGATALLKFGLDGAAAFNETAQAAIKFSRQAGVSVEDASRLAAVADDFGVAAETVSKGVSKLAVNISQQPKLFEEYGVSIARTKEGATDVAGTLANLATAYQKTEDPAKRAAMLQELMGKGGKELVPILQNGGDALREWMAAVDESQVITGEEARRAEEYREAMDRLGDSFSDLQIEVGQRLVPALSSLANVGAQGLEGLNSSLDWVEEKTEKVGGLGGVFKQVANAAIPGAGTAFGFLADKADKAADAQERVEKRTEAARDEMLRQVEATQELEKAMDSMVEASMAAVNSQLGLERANKSVTSSTAELNDRKKELDDTTKKHKANSEEAKQAQENLARAEDSLKQSIVGAAQAAVRAAEDQAKMNNTTLSAGDTARIYKDRLVELGNQAGGPVRDQVLKLAEIVKDPSWAEKHVKISLQTEAALAELARFEARLARSPGATISVGINGQGQVVQRRASGGPLKAGQLAEVVEGGKTELWQEGGKTYLLPGKDGQVVSNADLAPSSSFGAAAATTNHYHLTVYLPSGADGEDVVNALERFARQGGSLGPVTRRRLTRTD